MHGRFFGDSAKLLDVDSDAVAAAAAAAEEPAPAPRRRRRRSPINSGGFFSRFGGSAATSHTTAPLVAADAPTSSTARARARTARRPSCTTLLDNPVALVDSHPDIANDDTAAAAASTSGDFAMRGLLYKRVAAASAVGGWRRRSPRNGESDFSSSLAVTCSAGGRRRTTRRGRRARSTTRSTSAASRCSATWRTRGGGLPSSRSSNGARAWSLRAPTEEARLGVGAEARRRHADALVVGEDRILDFHGSRTVCH